MELPPGWTSRLVRVAPRVRLHCVSAGDDGAAGRRLLILLHGFPEFWYAWRRQIQPLADAGFHVVAPDLRGYNRSDAPAGIAPYRLPNLVDDVARLIEGSGHERATLVGHDWGGIIAWYAAMWRPDVVDRLVVLNAPHPAAYRREMRRLSRQVLMSWYAMLFQLPWLPEALIRFDDFAVIRRLFRHDPARRDAFIPEDVEHYVRALRPRRTLTAALNYYRAAFREILAAPNIRRIAQPVLLLWGERDRALSVRLTEGLHEWVPDLTLRRYPHATHWLHHDAAEEVTRQIVTFAAP